MDMPNPALTIRLFGQFDVLVHGLPLPKLRSRKEKWLLALLALEPGQAVTRVKLAQTLWPFPDHSADLAAYNLRRSLTELRKALGAEVRRLQSPTPQTLMLDLTDTDIDLIAFDEAIACGDPASLQRAVALYRGPLLVECRESWIVQERTKREQVYLQALEQLSAQAVTGGDYETAFDYLRRSIAVDPLRESARRALMELLAKSGDYNAAIQTYQQLSRLLHRELNSAPDPETTALFHALRVEQRSHTRRATPEADAPRSPSPRRIPVPLTTLVGREEQVRGIETRFRLVRLLTLTGSGGVGKTRLAIQVAEALEDDFRDGVWFVDLGKLTDPALVAQTVASALEIREEPGQPLVQTLVDSLQPKQLLLILDGCEHLIPNCAQLAESLLQGCLRLKLLTTSRQPLGISGESVWRVPSLSLPDPRRLPPDDRDLPAHLLDYAAIRLFVERASLVQPDFQLTPHNARSVAQICLRLDGIPLAIELAAARVKALPVEQIARRFNQLFRLLTGGPRTAYSRQQTMEATIQWSYDLLTEAERRLFCHLCVFSGGWTLDAAEQVCSAAGVQVFRSSGVQEKPKPTLSNEVLPRAKGDASQPEYLNTRIPEHLKTDEVLDLLTSLVDKSLVMYQEQEGQARYRFLETVRHYSRERLAETEESEIVSNRHLEYFLGMAEEAGPTLFGSASEAWLSLLETEHDNLRSALEWSLEDRGGEGEKGRRGERENNDSSNLKSQVSSLSLASALWRFWYRRSYLSEGLGWLTTVLARASAQERTAERAQACNGAAFLASHLGDTRSAQSYFEESLSIAMELGDKALIAECLHSQGYIAWYWDDNVSARKHYESEIALRRELGDREAAAVTLSHLGVIVGDMGDVVSAHSFFEESLSIAKDLGDKALIATCLHSQGHVAFYQRDYVAARKFYGEVLSLGQDLHDRTRIATALHRLGNVASAEGDYTAACRYFEESLALARTLEEKPLIAAALHGLGTTLVHQGDNTHSLALLEECLTTYQELRDKRGIANTLDLYASLAIAQHEATRTTVLLGAADALRSPQQPSSRADENPNALAARSALGEEAYLEARNRGLALTLEEAISYALHDAGVLNSPPT